MLSYVTPKEPPLELEPVPWLTSFLRAEYEIRRAPTPTEHLPVVRSNVRQPRGWRADPRPHRVTEAKTPLRSAVLAVLPDYWVHPRIIAERSGRTVNQVRRCLFDLGTLGLVQRERGPSTAFRGNGLGAWWYRRAA